MECIALTGIFPQVIEELKKGIPRTIELTSAHNVISLTQVTPGSLIFLTTVDAKMLLSVIQELSLKSSPLQLP